MNQNRPFFSTNTNLYDESFRSSAPATLNGQNVILSQEQQRRIYDTLNTAIVGNSFPLNNGLGNMQVLQAQKQFFPGGVMFTFNQPQHHVPRMCCKCPAPNTVPMDQNNFQFGGNAYFPSSFENQLPFCEVQPLCGLDYLKCQQKAARNPFQLTFHNDHSTSSSDLLNHFTQVPASKGCPDLCNINGVLHQNQVCFDTSQLSKNSSVFFPVPPIEFSSNRKKLVLLKNVAPSGHVVDDLTENEKNEMDKKRVSFSDDQSESFAKGEKSSQTSCNCTRICDAKKCRPKKTKKQINNDPSSTGDESSYETPKKKKEKKRRKIRSKSDTTSSDSTDVSSNSEDYSDSEKPKKFRLCCNKQRQTNNNAPSDRSDTETEKIKSNGNETKRNKKRKNNNSSKNLTGDTDDEQNLSDCNQQSSTSDHSQSDENKGRFVLCDKCLTQIYLFRK